jgi:DnaJ-class molecular chaperone
LGDFEPFIEQVRHACQGELLVHCATCDGNGSLSDDDEDPCPECAGTGRKLTEVGKRLLDLRQAISREINQAVWIDIPPLD